jgi:hypothetical protein
MALYLEIPNKKKKLIMKLFPILILLLTLCINTYSQEFKYTKIHSQGYDLKIKGKITVSDTLVTIYTDNTPSNFKVIKKTDTGASKSFKVLGLAEDAEMRIILNNVLKPTKKNPKVLLLETRDNFSNTYSSIIYYLKLADEQ